MCKSLTLLGVVPKHFVATVARRWLGQKFRANFNSVHALASVATVLGQCLVFALLLPPAAVILAQETEEAPDDETQKQIEQLIEQQNKLADEYNAILKTLKQDDELVALDKVIAAAKAELAKAEGDNQALVDARAAEADARDAVKLAVQQKLKEHGEGGQLLTRLEELRIKQGDHLWQIELAKFQLNNALSPVNRALAADDELAAAKAKLSAATIEDRSDAQAAYDELRAAKLDEIVEAQRLLATIEDSTDAAQRMLESIVAVEERLTPIRKQIERIESKRIEAAREQVAAALNSEAIVELREKLNERITEYNTLIKKLTADSEDAVRLKDEYDAVRAKIKELRTPMN